MTVGIRGAGKPRKVRTRGYGLITAYSLGLSGMKVPGGLALQRGNRLFKLRLQGGRVTPMGLLRVPLVTRQELADGNVPAEALSPDGRNFAVAGQGKGVRVLDIQTGRVVDQVIPAGRFVPGDGPIGFSPDGSVLTYRVRLPKRSGEISQVRARTISTKRDWLVQAAASRGAELSFPFAWSRTNRWILFSDGSSFGPPRPAVVEPYGGGAARRLVPLLNAKNGYGPNQWTTWSPGGSRVAYSGGYPGARKFDVWVARLRTPTTSRRSLLRQASVRNRTLRP